MIEEIARFRLEDVPFTLPARREMKRPAHPRAAAAPPRRGRRSPASASPRSTPRACAPTTTRRGSSPSRSRSSSPRSAPRSCRASSRPRGATSMPAPAESRSSRSRASTCPAATCPRSACASPGSPQGGFLHVKGVVETLYARAQGRARRSSAAEHPLLHPGKTARRPVPASSASSTRAQLEGEWGAFELDLGRALRRRRASPVTYRDVITFPASGRTSPSPSPRTSRSATSSPPPARRPARSCARSASSTSTAASRSARAASPSRSRSPTRPPSARSPRRTRRGCANAIVDALAERFGAELRAADRPPGDGRLRRALRTHLDHPPVDLPDRALRADRAACPRARAATSTRPRMPSASQRSRQRRTIPGEAP